MPIRTSMANIILELRGMTDASSTDTTVDGVQYWTDQQLQDMLDMYRADVLDLELIPAKQMEGGTDVYYRYYFPDSVGSWIENDPSYFSVVDENGNVAPTYTYDGVNRYVLFAANTNGATMLLRGRFFDLRKAAARVWFDKAGHRSALIDWKAGGQTLAEDQEWQHCMKMFELYSGGDGVKSILPGASSKSNKRLRKVGYGSFDSRTEYYPKGTEESINGPVA